MAQGDQRPRHHRQASRIPKFMNRSGDSATVSKTRNAPNHVDEATVRYIKRVLCAYPASVGSPIEPSPGDIDSKSLDELLPPLTSSNEVDVQLYAIIAVVLSQFVQSWYNRLTPDHEFVGEVVQIIAHCTRGLEERLRRIDLIDLLLDDLPSLVIAHIDGMHRSILSTFTVAANFGQLSGYPRPLAPQIDHQTTTCG